MAKENIEQRNLFGEIDLVYNCLHTELTIVNEDIESAQKSIERLEKKIGDLEERKEELHKSIEIVGKGRKKSEPVSPGFPDNNVKKCSSCGSILLDETKICPSCGREI